MRTQSGKFRTAISVLAIAFLFALPSAEAASYKVYVNKQHVKTKWTTPSTSFIANKGALPGGGKFHSRYATSRINTKARVLASGKVTNKPGDSLSWKQKTTTDKNNTKYSSYAQKDAQGEAMQIFAISGKRRSTSKVKNADGSSAIVKTWKTKKGMTMGIATEVDKHGSKTVTRFGGKTVDIFSPEPLFLRQH